MTRWPSQVQFLPRVLGARVAQLVDRLSYTEDVVSSTLTLGTLRQNNAVGTAPDLTPPWQRSGMVRTGRVKHAVVAQLDRAPVYETGLLQVQVLPAALGDCDEDD